MRRMTLTMAARVLLVVLVVLVAGGLLGALPAGTRAQEDQTTTLFIIAVNCPAGADSFDDGCAPAAGATFAVAAADGTALGGCTAAVGTFRDSGEIGVCTLVVPIGTVTVTEDVASLPAGTAPTENPRVVEVRIDPLAADYLPVASFLNVAQPPPAEDVALLVSTILCPTAAGQASGDCTAAAGVTAAIALPDGTALGGCTTEAGTIQDMETGFCSVDVPIGPVVATLDTATLPAGYVPTENPRTVEVRRPGPDVQDYVPVAFFILVPEAGPTAPVTAIPTTTSPPPTQPAPNSGTGARPAPSGAVRLPNTGAGTAAEAGGASALFAAAAVFGAIGIGLRRRETA